MSLIGLKAMLNPIKLLIDPVAALKDLKSDFDDLTGKTAKKEAAKKQEAEAQQEFNMEKFLAFMEATHSNNSSNCGNYTNWLNSDGRGW